MRSPYEGEDLTGRLVRVVREFTSDTPVGFEFIVLGQGRMYSTNNSWVFIDVRNDFRHRVLEEQQCVVVIK